MKWNVTINSQVMYIELVEQKEASAKIKISGHLRGFEKDEVEVKINEIEKEFPIKDGFILINNQPLLGLDGTINVDTKTFLELAK